MILVLHSWMMIANAGYSKLKLVYEETYATHAYVMNEVFSLDEYDSQVPIAFTWM